MKKHILHCFLTLLFIIYWSIGSAQTASLFDSQSDIDRLDQSITSLTGSIIISGEDIVDLSNFSNITTVSGFLRIESNPMLKNLKGLENLNSIGRFLSVSSNDALENINDLKNLDSIAEYISISSNDILQNLNGLEKITSLNSLTIDENNALKDLNGLESIREIRGSLVIDSNEILQNFGGLENLTTIEGSLTIRDNPVLQNIEALGNLSLVRLSLTIDGNDSLNHLTGLSNLTSLESQLSIDSNDALLSLDGLNNIATVGGNFIIFNNDDLLNLDGLESITSIGGSIRISSNFDLLSIAGLANISSLETSITILQNAKLQNLDGLEGITSVTSFIRIEQNEDLQNVDGLINLTHVDDDFDLRINASLEHVDGLKNLKSVNGDLTIDANASLNNVNGLENLISVENDFSISANSFLLNIEGIANLSSVGRHVKIASNARLINFNGLESISTIAGNLTATYNTSIRDLKGLENITTILGDFSITNCSQLLGFEGVSNLQTIGGDLNINNNIRITNLNGLESITNIGGNLSIWQNDDLINLVGIDNLTSVGGYLYVREHDINLLTGLENIASIGGYCRIERCRFLFNINALAGLKSIGGYLEIEDNDNLRNLDGLENLITVGDDVRINSNSLLQNCCGIQKILRATDAIGGDIEIFSNPTECSSQEEIISVCEIPPTAQGCIYWDENQNGLKDDEERNLQITNSVIYPDDIFSFLDTTGCFTHFLDNGEYTFTFLPAQHWELSSSVTEYDILVNDDNHSGLDFGFIPIDTFIAGNYNVTSGIPRCSREVEFDFSFRNEGTTIIDGKLSIVIDTFTEVSSFFHPADSILNDTIWEWHFYDLYPGELVQRTAFLKMPDVEETDSIHVSSALYAINDLQEEINIANDFKTPILCAYDPNDKLVSPNREGDENYTLFDEDMFYTIRFQNTGNDTAFMVAILDTLDENLSISSLRILASSHQDILRTEVTESKFVAFIFENILLPDSTTNFNESQGYVTYTIQSKDGLNENTVVNNTASIYFDFNPPIVTNTTQNTLVSCLPIQESIVEAAFISGDNYTLPDGMVIDEAGTYITEFLDEEGCPSEIIKTILDELTSSSSLVLNEFVSLNPNPTTGVVTFDIKINDIIDHKLKLSDVYGQNRFTKKINNAQTILFVDHLEAGIYWVQLLNKENELVAVQKVVITK